MGCRYSSHAITELNYLNKKWVKFNLTKSEEPKYLIELLTYFIEAWNGTYQNSTSKILEESHMCNK